jgi:hypothetical protein
MEPLSAHLERRDRGAAVLHVRLHLVTRVVHERSLQLPAPMRDARALRTLALLDLESHPPDAGIDRVTVAVDPTPGRVVQFSLLTRPLPSPEQVSTLTARLAALMGDSRCGSPEVVDSWRPGAFAMKPFNPGSGIGDRKCTTVSTSRSPAGVRLPTPGPASPIPRTALSRLRMPIPARVRVEYGRPIRVWIDPPSLSGPRWTSRHGFGGGRVEVAAGPWRTSGAWWEEEPVTPKPRSGEGGWSRDEWDVALADGVTYRLFHDRRRVRLQGAGGWYIEGIVD